MGDTTRPPRPLLVKALAPSFGLAALGSLGLGVYFFVAPFFFAAKDGGFNVLYFVGSLLFFGMFGVLFLVFAVALLVAGVGLWGGDDESARGIGLVGGGFFAILLAMGFSNQPSIGPEHVTAIVSLAIPAVLLLASAGIVSLPHVQRWVAECERVDALRREAAEPALPDDGVGGTATG
jgi:hypothetical protein